MSATLHCLLAQRRAVSRSICGQIDRLRALDMELLRAANAESPARCEAVLDAICADDNALLARFEGVLESETAR